MLDDLGIFIGYAPVEPVTEGLFCYLERIFVEGFYLLKEDIHHLMHLFMAQQGFSIYFEFDQPEEVLNYVFVTFEVKTFDQLQKDLI